MSFLFTTLVSISCEMYINRHALSMHLNPLCYSISDCSFISELFWKKRKYDKFTFEFLEKSRNQRQFVKIYIVTQRGKYCLTRQEKPFINMCIICNLAFKCNLYIYNFSFNFKRDRDITIQKLFYFVRFILENKMERMISLPLNF